MSAQTVSLLRPLLSPNPIPTFNKPSHLIFLPRPRTTLKSHPAFVTSTTSSPIFLPHLEAEEAAAEAAAEEQRQQQQTEEPEILLQQEEDEEEFDPIRDFFKSRSPSREPSHEGRLSLKRNRRTSWRLADFDDDETNPVIPDDDDRMSVVSEPDTSPENGVLEEMLQLARSISENSTLGDFLGPYVGKVREGDCIELLERMGEEGLVRGCLYLFEWMGLQEPSLLTPRACSVLFPILGRAEMGASLMALFENLPQAKEFRDVRVYNAAISGLSCCRRYDDAWRIYEALEANNIQPDHVTCSILITVMRKSGRSAKEAWQFFEKMNRKGVRWSLEVVGALIKSFCDDGLKKEALIIQSEMEKKGIPSNAVIYNTLIDAYGKCNRVEEAEGLFTEMKDKGVKPTVATYNVLMDAYSRRMQPDIIEDLLSEMQNLGLKPNVKSYTSLTLAYGRQRTMSDMAANSFLRMKKAGIKPTSHSYTALIHAYSVGGWHEKAYAAYESMTREGITPSIETYTTLLDAFRRAGETRKLMEIWKIMTGNKVEGTRVTFNIIVDGLAKQGLYVQARDVIYEFGRIGLQPTVMTYNMLMNAYARGGQHYKLPQLLKEMTDLNLKPDSITYSTMIYAYVRVRYFARAFYFHKQMVKSGKMPDAGSYSKLRSILDVKAAGKNKKDRSAILGIVNSKFGLKPRRGKKDEFWKNRKRPSLANKVTRGRDRPN